MMRRSTFLSSLAAAFALLLPAALAAQSATPPATRPPGCRGTNTSTSSFTIPREGATPWVFPSYAEIESVQPGSPAELGGMKVGDVVMAQDGHDLVANPPKQPALAGDTVRFVVWREGREVPLTVVLGRWDPPQESPGVTRVCRRVDAGGS